MRKTAIFQDERTFWHATGLQALYLPVGRWVQPPSAALGADTPESKRRILSMFLASGLARLADCLQADLVTKEDLLRVHSEEYLNDFKAVSDAGGGDLGDFAPFSEGGYEIAVISAGLAVAAVDTVVRGDHERAYALCRPAGHHCLRDKSMGFCLLSNIPIAIEAAKVRHALGKIAIVDWDVHHGNGTQAAYYDRGDVLTISLHQENCFPAGYSGIEERGAGAGVGHNINIPLPPGCGHEAYLRALHTIVVPALEKFKPDLIVIASGLDANGLDPLARMLLHSQSYREMTELLSNTADRLCGGKLVVIHEGGYSEAYVPFCGQAVMEALMEVQTEVVDPALAILVAQQPSGAVLEWQKNYVDMLSMKLAH